MRERRDRLARDPSGWVGVLVAALLDFNLLRREFGNPVGPGASCF